MKHVKKEVKSAFRSFIEEALKTLNIFLILVTFSIVVLLAAKGISPLHTGADQRASDYSQLQ